MVIGKLNSFFLQNLKTQLQIYYFNFNCMCFKLPIRSLIYFFNYDMELSSLYLYYIIYIHYYYTHFVLAFMLLFPINWKSEKSM